MKRVLSILLCLAVVLSFTAFAEETPLPQPDATVTITANKSALTVDETGLELTIDIVATEKIITQATVTINIDNDAIKVTDATPVAETTYNYEIAFDEITEPGTTAQKIVPLEIAKYDVADGTAVNVSIVSATIKDNAEPVAEMTSDITSTAAITVNNPAVDAKLIFAEGIKTLTDDITVTYEEVVATNRPSSGRPSSGGGGSQSSGNNTPEGDGGSGGGSSSEENDENTENNENNGGEPQPQSEEIQGGSVENTIIVRPTQKAYTTTLTLKADGKTVAVHPVLGEGETKMADGTYKVVIAAAGYKAEAVADITIDAEHTVPVWDADMTAGYINDDDIIDLYDFHTLCMAIGAEELAVACDLNRDGEVNKKDAALLVKNWTLPVVEEGDGE